MKFQHLEIGQRFEFEDKIYSKTGPVSAVEEASGKQRMIPRYAVLKPLGETPKIAKHTVPDMLSRAEVLAAFDAFCAECGDLATQDRFEQARQRFIDSL